MVQLPTKKLTINEFINSFGDNYKNELSQEPLWQQEPVNCLEEQTE